MYRFTKGGTDIIDQEMGFYTCRPESRKSAITVFSYVIDMAPVNSSTIFALQKKYIYFFFLTTLVKQKIKLVIGQKEMGSGR